MPSSAYNRPSQPQISIWGKGGFCRPNANVTPRPTTTLVAAQYAAYYDRLMLSWNRPKSSSAFAARSRSQLIPAHRSSAMTLRFPPCRPANSLKIRQIAP